MHKFACRKKLQKMKRDYVSIHNQMLRTRKSVAGEDYKILPYQVDEDTLARSKKQPKFVKKGKTAFVRDVDNIEDWIEGERKDEADRRICRGELVGEAVKEQVSRKQLSM